MLSIFAFAFVGLAYGENDDSNYVEANTGSPIFGGRWFADSDDPLWTVRSDYLYMKRSPQNARNLVTKSSGSSPGTVFLNANEFRFDYSPGWDVSLIRQNVLGTQWSLEGLYSSIDDWSASRGIVHSTGGAYVRYKNVLGTPTTSTQADISGDYQSNLHNFELNVRRDICPRGAFLMGFRYVNLREHLDILNEFYTTPHNLMRNSIEAKNSLIGFQMGFDGHVFSVGRFSVDGFVKAGVFNNTVQNSVAITQTGASYKSAGRDVNTSFVGDAEISGVYKITKHLSARAGYQWMWLGGVGLVTDQVPVSDPKNGTANVSLNTTEYYNGAFGGLEFNF